MTDAELVQLVRQYQDHETKLALLDAEIYERESRRAAILEARQQLVRQLHAQAEELVGTYIPVNEGILAFLAAPWGSKAVDTVFLTRRQKETPA